MRWVTVKEFAKEIGEAESTVRAKCTSGEWYSIKFGKQWKLDADKVYEQIDRAIKHRMEKPLVIRDVPEDVVIKLRKQRIVENIGVCTMKCI